MITGLRKFIVASLQDKLSKKTKVVTLVHLDASLLAQRINQCGAALSKNKLPLV
jgi:hypothetical protein